MRELGSSPHARGAHFGLVNDEHTGRAHPRMRGEHPCVGRDVGPELRLIPACAGSTCCRRWVQKMRAAHPRMRGEHEDELDKLTIGEGSSPHARGAPRERHQRPGPRGLIPACAGSTPSSNPSGTTTAAHPRMRGEHPMGAPVSGSRMGSSPHARGALADEAVDRCDGGLIPACAGSTL